MAGPDDVRLAEMVESAIAETAASLVRRGMSTDHELISQFVLGKSATSFAAVGHLCKKGFGPDALVVARSILENAINLAYINRDPEKMCGRFLEFEHVEEYRQLEALKDATNGEMRPSPSEEAEIESEYRKVKDDYKGPSWSGASIQAMASECGLGLEYAQVYRLASGFAHGGARSVHTYIERKGPQYDVRLGAPGEEFTGRALLSASISMLLVMNEVCRAYGIDPPPAIREAQDLGDNLGRTQLGMQSGRGSG